MHKHDNGSRHPELDGLIGWFHLPCDNGAMRTPEPRSHEMLEANLARVLQMDLSRKQLDIVLFGTAKAIHKNHYGERASAKDRARRIVKNNIQKWTDKFLKKFGGPTSDKKNDFAFTISQTLKAFQLLEMQPPERLMQRLEQKIVEHAREFSPADVVDTFSAIGRLALPLDDNAMRALMKRTKELAASFSPHDSAQMVHALAMMDAVQAVHKGENRPRLDKTFGTLLSDPVFRQKAAVSDDEKDSVRKIWDAMYWFYARDPAHYPKNDDTESLFESDVRDAFEKSGATAQKTEPHPVTGKRPDLKIAFSDKTHVVECDGPTHFLWRADDHCVVLNGSTLFQTALQVKREPETAVIRLPHDVFYANKNNKDLWETVLLHAADTKGGGYVVGPGGMLTALNKEYDPKYTHE